MTTRKNNGPPGRPFDDPQSFIDSCSLPDKETTLNRIEAMAPKQRQALNNLLQKLIQADLRNKKKP